MKHLVMGLVAALALSGCVNLYTHLDDPETGFPGIRDWLSEPVLHVVQIHGMGDHPASSYCAPTEENYKLQGEIVARIGYHHVGGTRQAIPIPVGKTVVGSYTTDIYVDSTEHPVHQLFFTCLTWGDADRELKQEILQLNDDFTEKSANERHRSPINSYAKRFINRSFSDPVIYVGPFGRTIREAVWTGLQQANVRYQELQASMSGIRSIRTDDIASIPTVVLSDSLGSRVLFDTLCERQNDCAANMRGSTLPSRTNPAETSWRSEQTRRAVREVFMLANQLPLLELANVNPDPNKSVAEWLRTMPCQLPLAKIPDARDQERTTIVALSDANDPLSYELSQSFKDRCSGFRIVNVTLVNARLRWFGLYTNMSKAHASGFKTNPDAIKYMVEGVRSRTTDK